MRRPRSRTRLEEVAALASQAVEPIARVTGRTARDHVTRQVAQLAQAGALDAGNGDVLDAWLEGLRREWHAGHVAERTNRIAAAQHEVGRLEAAAVHAEQRAEAAAAELEHTERVLAVLEKRILEPAELQSADQRERRRRPRPTLDPLEGLVRPRFHRFLITALLLLAAAGDLAMFRLVLATEFRDGGELVIVALTVAFAAASVGLMHGVGRALKDLREARGGLGRPALVLMFLGWLTLGGVAFLFRLQSETAAPADSPFGVPPAAAAEEAAQHALLSAALLAGLFLASGLLAFYAGFSEHHPRMTTYLALRQMLPAQREQAATTAWEANEIRQALDHARGEEARAVQRAADGIAAADAEIAELKELVRVEVAGYLGLPEATNGLITARHPEVPRSTPDVGPAEVFEPRADGGTPRPGGGAIPSPRDGHPVFRIPRDAFPVVAPPTLDGSSNGHGSANGHRPADGIH